MKKLLFLIPCFVLLFAGDAYAQKHSGSERMHRYNRNADAPNKSGDTYCKRYSREVRKGGQIEEEYGTACLDKQGNWRVKK
ncbi:MAG: hypothetical protein FWF23_01785 [Alphaproteobacteria bacterium]|nr:hypothetical protein [Alphaproteobacteria bacterium]MCL2504653.1 hypothetical protein [Alphaproteobacteria bacterium]